MFSPASALHAAGGGDDEGPYCELKPNAGRDNTWVWKIPGTGGDPEYFALKVASKELALKFKGIFEGARMLNDAATAATGIG